MGVVGKDNKSLGDEKRNGIGIIKHRTEEVISNLCDEAKDELEAQVNVLQMAVRRTSYCTIDKGARDDKELKNFLFNDDNMVMAVMYIAGAAKLWWCSKFVNDVKMKSEGAVRARSKKALLKFTFKSLILLGKLKFKG
ncbi:hypothetical protein V6Z11_A07G172600 [Gossypium hirsutum]